MSISNTARYALGGFLFGLLFPTFSWILDGLIFHEFGLSWQTIADLHQTNPIHYIIDSAPLVLGTAFAAIGYQADKTIGRSLLNKEIVTADNRRLVKRMSTAMMVVPAAIIIVVLMGFTALYTFLSIQRDDATVINVAGKQRMYSQNIAKNAIYLTIREGDNQVKHINELSDKMREFKEAHDNLTKKSTTKGFSSSYELSPSIQSLYDSLQPHYDGLLIAVDELLVANNSSEDSTTDKADAIKTTIMNVNYHEQRFLSIMDAIVNEYNKEVEEKVTLLHMIQTGATLVIILFILAITLLGYRPLVSRIKEAFIKVEEVTAELEVQNEELAANEEEMRKNTEELQAINDRLILSQQEIESQSKLLYRAEVIASLGSYSFDIESDYSSYSQNLPIILGIKSTEMVNLKRIIKYFHPEDRILIEKQSIEMLNGEHDTLSFTGRFKGTTHKDWRYLHFENTLERNEIGKGQYVIGVIQDVTETVLQTQAIKAQQSQLQRIFEAIPNYIYEAELDMITNEIKITSSNRIGAALYGLPKTELDKDVASVLKVIVPQDQHIVQEALKQAVQTMQPQQMEYRIEKDGQLHWLQGTLLPSQGEKENTIIMTVMVSDITREKQSQLQLRQTKNRLQSLSDNLQGVMFRTNIDDNWTMEFISSGVEDLTGYPYTCFLRGGTKNFADVIHKDDNYVDREIEKAIQNKTSYQIEYRVVHQDGREKWVEEIGKPVFDKEGRATYLDGVIMDISQRKKSEELIQTQTEELLRSQAELEERQLLLKEAQLISRTASYETDLATKFVEWSDSFQNVFKAEAPTSTEGFTSWINQEDIERLNASWAKSIKEKSDFDEVYRIINPEGREFYIRERGYPIFDEENKLVRMRGTLQDITSAQRQRLEAEQKSIYIAKQNENLVASINYAQRIQSAILGSTQDAKSIFKDIFVFFEPRDVVSGDFYWFNQVNGRKVIIVADCTGHGVPGAFMSLLGATILNEIILQRNITTPSKILDELHKQISYILKQDTTQNRDGMDIAVVVIDESVGMLEFAGAKNPLVCINKQRKRGGAEANLTVIKGDNLSIGGRGERFMDNEYTNHILDLDTIEAFYIFSDGFQDQFGGEEGRKFMSKNFRELLYKTHSTSMRHQRVSLKRTLMNWLGTEYQQIDDICVVGISV